jgi:hypothetical protein
VHQLRLLLALGEQATMTRLILLVGVLPLLGLVSSCSGSSKDGPQGGADSSQVTPGLNPMAPGDATESSDDGLPVSFGPPECDQCLSRSCSAEVAACNADAACTSLFGCITDCANQSSAMACFGGCLLSEGNPPAELFSFLDCLSSECETECGPRVTSD